MATKKAPRRKPKEAASRKTTTPKIRTIVCPKCDAQFALAAAEIIKEKPNIVVVKHVMAEMWGGKDGDWWEHYVKHHVKFVDEVRQWEKLTGYPVKSDGPIEDQLDVAIVTGWNSHEGAYGYEIEEISESYKESTYKCTFEKTFTLQEWKYKGAKELFEDCESISFRYEKTEEDDMDEDNEE